MSSPSTHQHDTMIHVDQSYFATSIDNVIAVLRETEALWTKKCSNKSIVRRKELSDLLDVLDSLSVPDTYALRAWVHQVAIRMALVYPHMKSVTSMIKGCKRQLYVDHHITSAKENVMRIQIEVSAHE